MWLKFQSQWKLEGSLFLSSLTDLAKESKGRNWTHKKRSFACEDENQEIMPLTNVLKSKKGKYQNTEWKNKEE